MKKIMFCFILAFALLMGCSVNKKEVYKETALPLEVSNTVKESDLKRIDWNKPLLPLTLEPEVIWSVTK
jgi:hypothetical protein